MLCFHFILFHDRTVHRLCLLCFLPFSFIKGKHIFRLKILYIRFYTKNLLSDCQCHIISDFRADRIADLPDLRRSVTAENMFIGKSLNAFVLRNRKVAILPMQRTSIFSRRSNECFYRAVWICLIKKIREP